MRTSLHILAVLLVSAVAAQAGDIYRWKDASGYWHYSDQPVPGAERLGSANRVQPPEKDRTAAPSAATQPAGAAATAGKATLDKVREDVAADKAAKCKEAQAGYQQTISTGRLYKQGPKGEQIFLNDEEIEAARVTARANMEYYCGK